MLYGSLSATAVKQMSDQLEQLSKMTVLVADTGDIEAIQRHKPTDATTNPSLLLKAAAMKQYRQHVDKAIEYALTAGAQNKVEEAMDKLAVIFGAEIATIVPGVVSTEVDARLSFDTQGSIAKARRLIALYKEMGIDKDRVLIKLASTWEGIKAAEQLEKEGIHCNMTLLFSMPQAVACAEAAVSLVSPFVGRVHDWFAKSTGKTDYAPLDDPGVKLVTSIYRYYKEHGYQTVVMGASFRNKGQVLALAGCDKLTISPALLDELRMSHDVVPRVLSPPETKGTPPPKPLDEKTFRYMLNEDQMATEKLSEGIRLFAADCIKCEQKLARERLLVVRADCAAPVCPGC